MITQDWEKEKYMEDVYLFEKQFEQEWQFWNNCKRKPGKIRVDEYKIKHKPRAFRRTHKKRVFSRHSISVSLY